MPRYAYRGVDRSGAPDVGVVDGVDEVGAFATLQSRGVTVLELGDPASLARAVPWYAREVTLWPSALPLAQQAQVAELMSVLFRLRLPLTDTLRLIEEGAENPKVRRHFARTGQRIADGTLLPAAFKEAGTDFAPLFHVLLRVGDAANTMPETFAELARYLRAQERLRGKLTSALIYPAVLVAAAIGLVLVIVFYLAPSLAPMFASLNRPLPPALGMFMAVREAIMAAPLAVLAGILALPSAAIVLGTRPAGRRVLGAIVARLPVFGTFIREARLLRRLRALHMLLVSGTPLADALEMVATFLGEDRDLDLAGAVESLRRGGRASDVFATSRRLPRIVRDLLSIGEATNRLPDILAALTRTLEDRIDATVQRARQLITPLLTLGLGLGLGFLIYSIMNAILEINELAS